MGSVSIPLDPLAPPKEPRAHQRCRSPKLSDAHKKKVRGKLGQKGTNKGHPTQETKKLAQKGGNLRPRATIKDTQQKDPSNPEKPETSHPPDSDRSNMTVDSVEHKLGIIEEDKSDLLLGKNMSDNDDLMFFKSLLPYMSELSTTERLKLRSEINYNVVCALETKERLRKIGRANANALDHQSLLMNRYKRISLGK